MYSFDSMITLPNDMSQVTYPTSYTKASVGSVKVTDPYCGTDPSTISFPASYLGAYALPQATGYPLNAAIRRGYSMKDVWQPGIRASIPAAWVTSEARSWTRSTESKHQEGTTS